MGRQMKPLKWHIAPKDQGQIVEVSWAETFDGVLEKIFDKSDRSFVVRIHPWLKNDAEFDPWNELPVGKSCSKRSRVMPLFDFLALYS
jgi:hypothetical protein